MTTNKYAVPALDKGLDILEYLVSQDRALSQTDIATGIGRKPNEIFRVLVGLEARGYLLREEKTGHYRLSFKLYHLSRHLSPIDQVRQCALPYMEDLAVELGQSCYLAMLYQSQTMIIVHANSHSPISLTMNEGALFSTTSCTAGKVLLAASNTDVRKMILERDEEFTALSKRTQANLLQQLEEIKEARSLSAPNPLIASASDFATLIGNPEGKVIAALATTTLKTSKDHKNSEQHAHQRIKECALKISHDLCNEA